MRMGARYDFIVAIRSDEQVIVLQTLVVLGATVYRGAGVDDQLIEGGELNISLQRGLL